MAVVDVVDTSRNKVAQIDVSDTILMHRCGNIFFMMCADAACRQAQRHRSYQDQIRGERWRKKALEAEGHWACPGRLFRSPLWRGGGTMFGPTPRSYEYAVPKKVRKLALCSALSMKRKENKMLIVDKLELQEIKTAAFVTLLKQLGFSNVLIIAQENSNLEKSARNVRR